MIDTISYYLAYSNEAIVRKVCKQLLPKVCVFVWETNITFGYRIENRLPFTIANRWNDIDYFAKIDKRFHESHIDTNTCIYIERPHWILNWFDVWTDLKFYFLRIAFKFITFWMEKIISLSAVISNLIVVLVHSPASERKILYETFHSLGQIFISHHQQEYK